MGEERGGASRQPIHCVGKDGVERTFYCEREDGRQPEGPGFALRLYEAPEGAGDFFEARFVECGGDELQVVMLNHQFYPAFMAKGLPEAAILEAETQTPRLVVSSVNGAHARLLNERQEPEAEKVWLRLVGRGLAQRRADGRYALLRAEEERQVDGAG